MHIIHGIKQGFSTPPQGVLYSGKMLGNIAWLHRRNYIKNLWDITAAFEKVETVMIPGYEK